jgi:hypothetical protein
MLSERFRTGMESGHNIPVGTCVDFAKKKQQAKNITDQEIFVADGHYFSGGS